jgi:hypothetical protein
MAELVEFKAGRSELVNGVLVAQPAKGLLKWLVYNFIISTNTRFTLSELRKVTNYSSSLRKGSLTNSSCNGTIATQINWNW